MTKKDYKEPTMRIVNLQQQAQLLAGSIVSGRQEYGEAMEEEWNSRQVVDDLLDDSDIDF